jgi:hypothetical protein
MKTVFFLFALLSFSFVSSQASSTRLIGNGVATTNSKLLYDFESLQVEGPFQVFLTYGSVAEVTVEADQNLMSSIEVTQTDGKLVVRADDRISANSILTLYITVQELTEMDFKNVFSVETTNTLWSDEISIDMETLGNTILNLVCNKLSVELTGAGNLELSGTVNEMSVINRGIGMIKTKNLDINTISTEKNKLPLNIQVKQSGSEREIFFFPTIVPYAVRP